jgi:hypothetical protein
MNKKLTFHFLILVLIVALTSSCLTTKTSVGDFNDKPGVEYTYAKGKQIWLFWGLIPLGRTSVNTPQEKDCKVITRFNFSDVLVSSLTGGLVTTYTIKIKAKRIEEKVEKEAKASVIYDFKTGDNVVFSHGFFKNIEGEIIAVYADRAVIKFMRPANLIEKAKNITGNVEDKMSVPFGKIAKK